MTAVLRLSHMVMLAWGWHRAAIAFAAGAISALALAPFNLWPVLFLTFPVLVWLIDGSGAGRLAGIPAAALTGWWFGFGYFIAGLYWVGHAFLVDAKTFGWLLPIAVITLPAGLALFTAAGAACARLLWMRGSLRILSLAVALTAAEWLRGHILTGFPWNAFGYALTGPLVLAQTASLIGIWGLTFIAVAVFASPAALADEKAHARGRLRPLLLSVALLAVMAGYGTLRLAFMPTGYIDGVKLRIMQPNLQQDEKFNYGSKQAVMRRYLSLSDRATTPQQPDAKFTHLIWPESAFPFFLPREPDALAQIADLLPPGTMLITGGVRPANAVTSSARVRAYNSVYVIDDEGTITAVYDKVHLVPFGEYLPFQPLLERIGLMQLTKVQGGFLSGDRLRNYTAANAPRFTPLICYEAIFPGNVVPQDDRPGWLLNVTNDGWFGISTGPYQHLQQARLRAIEEGLPLIRAANTGISAIIDPLGRMIATLPLGSEGILDGPLPKAASLTFYARTGDGPILLFLFALTGIILRYRWRRDA